MKDCKICAYDDRFGVPRFERRPKEEVIELVKQVFRSDPELDGDLPITLHELAHQLYWLAHEGSGPDEPEGTGPEGANPEETGPENPSELDESVEGIAWRSMQEAPRDGTPVWGWILGPPDRKVWVRFNSETKEFCTRKGLPVQLAGWAPIFGSTEKWSPFGSLPPGVERYSAPKSP